MKYLDKNLSQRCSANQNSHIDSNYLKIVVNHEFSYFFLIHTHFPDQE